MPDMAPVIATSSPAIATPVSPSEIEITPWIGLVTAAMTETTIVEKSAMPRAIGQVPQLTKEQKIAEAERKDDGEEAANHPAGKRS